MANGEGKVLAKLNERVPGRHNLDYDSDAYHDTRHSLGTCENRKDGDEDDFP